MLLQKSIFKKSSKTYYYSTIFFPKSVRSDVYKLYAFVRTADDFVDMTPQDSEGFYDFKAEAYRSLDSPDVNSENHIIAGFSEIFRKYNFEKEWIESFFGAMESDLGEVRIGSADELESYMYGSAAMVGYMMCAIFGVRDPKSLHAAKMLAYSMQYINFIRDVSEDNDLGRRYLYGLNGIHYDGLVVPNDTFETFIHSHIKNYYEYLHEAREGLYGLPLRFRVPVLTASTMYEWTARRIKENPRIIFEKKVKPKKLRIIVTLAIIFLSQSVKGLFSSTS